MYLPLHLDDTLQPLNKTFMNLLEEHYREEVNQWFRNLPLSPDDIIEKIYRSTN